MKKMLALFLALSRNITRQERENDPAQVYFDDAVWERTLQLAAANGFNTVVLEVDSAVQYESHPEISLPDAWSCERVKAEVARCKAMGLSLIPMVNFSANHDRWLGEYGEMLTTDTYRRVADDVIHDLHEMFEHPAFIHIGMDEENEVYVNASQRPGKLYWEDFRCLIDSVKSTGAKPWIWADPLFENTLMFATNIAPDEAVLSPWYYHAFRPEHYTPTDSAPEYVEYYGREQFAKLNLKYVEEDPLHSITRLLSLPLMEKGYCYIPCASVHNRCIYNTPELLEFFLNGAPEDQLIGFMTAPWARLTEDFWTKIEQSILLMGKAAKDQGIL